MIDHKKNRENIIRDLKLNLIGPSPCGKPIKIDENNLGVKNPNKIYRSYK